MSTDCGHERVAARDRLRPRRGLSRLLRHRLLVDADERLAVRAVEDVDPARLVRLRGGLAEAAVDRHVEQHHGTRTVVVPEVVMNLLKVPAILAGGRVDGHHRRREQVVARANPAVEVGPRIAGGEVDQARARDRRPASATRSRRRAATPRCSAARCRARSHRGRE